MGIAPKPSGFANTKAGKAKILERTRALLETSSIVIAIPAQGISKEQTDMLRKELPAATKASVVKNALMRTAVEGTQFAGMKPSLKQQNMFFFVPEGSAKGTMESFKKWQKEVKRTDELFDAKFGAMDKQIFSGKTLEAVVNLPSKKELLTKIAQGIKAIPTKVARSVKAVPSKLGRALKALKDKKEKEAEEK